jgi:hypothetical protein
MRGFAIESAFWRLLCIFLLVAVVYFSWKPSPSIVQAAWVPRKIGLWLDEHDFAKNLIGYGALAFTIFMAWARTGAKPQEQGRRSVFLSIRERNLVIGFCSTVVVLELGQFAMRNRVCDWRDIIAGWSGGFLAWFLFRVVRRRKSVMMARA